MCVKFDQKPNYNTFFSVFCPLILDSKKFWSMIVKDQLENISGDIMQMLLCRDYAQLWETKANKVHLLT